MSLLPIRCPWSKAAGCCQDTQHILRPQVFNLLFHSCKICSKFIAFQNIFYNDRFKSWKNRNKKISIILKRRAVYSCFHRCPFPRSLKSLFNNKLTITIRLAMAPATVMPTTVICKLSIMNVYMPQDSQGFLVASLTSSKNTFEA